MVSIMVFLFKKSLFQQFLFCFERPCVDFNVWRRAWLDANSQSEREGRRSRDELALKRVNQPRNPLARLSRVLIGGHPKFFEKYVRRNSTYIWLLINFTPLKCILFQKQFLAFYRLNIDIYFRMRNIKRLYAKYKLMPCGVSEFFKWARKRHPCLFQESSIL